MDPILSNNRYCTIPAVTFQGLYTIFLKKWSKAGGEAHSGFSFLRIICILFIIPFSILFLAIFVLEQKKAICSKINIIWRSIPASIEYGSRLTVE